MKSLIACLALVLLIPGGAMAKPRMPKMPPDAPQRDEIEFDGGGDPIAARCAKFTQRQAVDLGERILKVIITRARPWGTVWRADISVPLIGEGSPMLWRIVCWRRATLVRPLEMLDRSANIPALP